jgi:hypothetical protein
MKINEYGNNTSALQICILNIHTGKSNLIFEIPVHFDYLFFLACTNK